MKEKINQQSETVFLSLPTLIHVSDILKGKTLEQLARKYKVIVLNPLFNQADAAKNNFPTSNHIVYEQLPLEHGQFWYVANEYFRNPFIREYDDWLITQEWGYRKIRSFKLAWVVPTQIFPQYPLFYLSGKIIDFSFK